jgi:hypothetical protein
MKCFDFSVQLFPDTCPILRRTVRDTIKNVYESSRKEPVILALF